MKKSAPNKKRRSVGRRLPQSEKTQFSFIPLTAIVAVGVLLVTALVVNGTTGSEPVTPEQNIVSPSVGRIVFSSNRTGNYEIFVMNADGTDVKQLTNDPAADSYPSFSYNNTKIAFTSDRGGNTDVYVMNADGTGVARLTTHAKGDEQPVFSPDGKTIAFVSHRDGNRNIYTMNAADGALQKRKTSSRTHEHQPMFSPDGKKIIYAYQAKTGTYPRTDIYTMNAADGSGKTRVAIAPLNPNTSEINEWPAYHPNGTKLLFQSQTLSFADVYAVHTNGSGRTHINPNPPQKRHPRYSSDGNYIVFELYASGPLDSDIHIMNAAGTEFRQLTTTNGRDWQASFSH